MIDQKAFGRFATDMAAAFSRLAEALAEPDARPQRVQLVGKRMIDTLPGERQRAVYAYLEKAGDEGKTTGEVNEGIGYKDFSNTYSTLHRLEQVGIVEMLPGVRPQTWRLSMEYRNGSS